MPSASSAAQPQPNIPVHHRNRGSRARRAVHRLVVGGLGVIVGLVMLLPAETILAPVVAADAQPGSCTGWTSTTKPPDYIRVLRNRTGRVERVPFKKYVVTVMGKEWPSYLPQAVIDAGAVAVKQFAWFHTLGNGRMSRRGQCFDVTDGIGDQLYKPGRSRVHADHYTAIADTWDIRLIKDGALFMTGYRTGSKTGCGHDATGWKLFARSAVRCADHGMGYLQILRTYYGPGLNVVTASPNQAAASSTAGSSLGPDAAQATNGTPTTDTATTTDTAPTSDQSMALEPASVPPSATPAESVASFAPFDNPGDSPSAGASVDRPDDASSAAPPLGQRAFTSA